MSRALDFHITFHTPFRVSTGHAKPGFDAGVDPDDPLPNTSLKGLFRASAEQLLGKRAPIVGAVFGSQGGKECPWRWGKATPDANGWHAPQAAARVSIDQQTHTATPDMLGISEQIGAGSATFRITQRKRLDATAQARHRLVLAVAGQAIRSIGADRRRGLGWVSITCPDVRIDRRAVEEFLALGVA